jgi:hypothetical protein
MRLRKEIIMKKLFFMLFALTAMNAYAVSGIGGCSGHHQGLDIKIRGAISDKSNIETAEGSLIIAGREVARFQGADLRYNILLWTFKARNNHGDLVEGKVKSITEKSATFSRIYIPAYGIDLRNIFVTCWHRLQ